MIVATLLTEVVYRFFLFNYTATTEIYTLSLHDALPISSGFDTQLATKPASVIRFLLSASSSSRNLSMSLPARKTGKDIDRKSTRLNSSHEWISYAVFCLKKKKKAIRHSNS